jgi:glycosyltransferase involved in cell wall biosynthesis
MKVIYSVATRFGGGGIGTTAFNAVAGIYSAGALDRIYCASNGQALIPAPLITSTNVSFLEGFKFLPSSYQWIIKDVAHDLLVSRQLGNSDIFHVWNGHGLYSIRKAKHHGARTVVERASSHPLTYERIINEELRTRGVRPQKLLNVNKKRLLAELLETDYIMTPSDFSYQSLVENGVPQEKLVKLAFGVDSNHFKPLSKRYSGFNVLFVGQVGFRKGVLYLLEAWKKLGLKGAQLRILGQEDSEIKPFLVPFRNDLSIKFLGYGDSLELYQNSNIFVLPSLEEGSALVGYEALACGLPIITTFESGSIAEDGQEGFIVKAGDTNQLAERLEYLYKHPELTREMSVRARKKAEVFSWQSYGSGLLAVYKRLV